MSPPAGQPVYRPASVGGLSARYVELSVTDNDGTPPCGGELRAFVAVPQSVLPYRTEPRLLRPHRRPARAVDVIGLSYYSFFHGSIEAMRQNVDDLATRYGKSIVIAESQYAWTLAGGDSTGNFVWQGSQPESGYPATPGVQLSFYNDLLSIFAQVPGHRALGMFHWEPEWIPGSAGSRERGRRTTT